MITPGAPGRHTAPSTTPPLPTPTARAGRVWEDLSGSLIWPGLLRAAGLALRPARMTFAFVLVLTLAVLVVAADAWVLRGQGDGSAVRGFGAIIKDQLTVVGGRLDAGKGAEGLWALILLPILLFREHAGVTMLLALPVAAAGAVFGGTIGRTAATEFGRRERTAWMDALVLSMRKWWTQSLAVLLPLVLIGVVAAALALLGRLLLGSSATGWVGGLLFGGGIVVGVFIVLALGVVVLALPMLVPAVLIEGTDSIDAVQRSAAYVVAHPLRYVLYAAVLFVQLLVMIGVLAAIVQGACMVTGTLAAMFLEESFADVVRQAAVFGTVPTVDAGEFPAWQQRAAGMIVFWRGLFQVVPAVYAVSYFYTAGSALYLSMRRLCDGQDPGELWKPSDDEVSAPRATAGTEEDL